MDSELDIDFLDKDSGMSSLGGSKDDTPERRAITVGHSVLKINKKNFISFTNRTHKGSN